MKVTSHFIGVKIKCELIADLLVSLQKNLGPYENALEFQNVLSAHITLYYLPAEISETNIENIRKVLQNFLTFPLRLNEFSYFGTQEAPRLCYLSTNDGYSELKNLNVVLRQSFPEYTYIPENLLQYVPHMTLFKIRDLEKFLELRDVLEETLKNELLRIEQLDLFDSFDIYKVNSEFKPEIQI